MKAEINFYFLVSVHTFVFIRDYNDSNSFLTQGKLVLKSEKKIKSGWTTIFQPILNSSEGLSSLDSNQVQWVQLLF